MPGLVEGLGMPAIVSIVSLLGLPGLVLVLWHGDRVRFERLELQRQEEAAKRERERLEELTAIKEQFTATVSLFEQRHQEVVQMYRDNVELVKGLDRVTNDFANIIHLNTQAMTRLVERIDNLLPARGMK